MDIPNRKDNDPERARLIRENSGTHLSSSIKNYYGSTPTNLRIPNVNSITDLQEVEQTINSYKSNQEDEFNGELPQKLSEFASGIQERAFKNSLDPNVVGQGSSHFVRLDSEASTSSNQNRQLTQSNRSTSTRPMNNLISSSCAPGHLNGQSLDNDTISLYHFMREQKKNFKAQIYESLDYEINENTLYLMEKKRSLRSKQKGNRFCKYIRSYFTTRKEFSRWFIIFLIGVFTALSACFIVVNVESLTKLKYERLQTLFDDSTSKYHELNSSLLLKFKDSDTVDTQSINKSMFTQNLLNLQIPLLFWFLTNAVPVFLASTLVTYLAPVAMASGIPVIKCYLNGVKVPEVVRVKTYVAKLFGVIGAVVGGLCSGKEGPMIHCASVIAAGLSQGKSTTLKQDLRVFREFREDHEKRDFVSAGAAAGVSAAFGAPIGGVLFALEEGASFWNQILTWRIFFCSLISTFTLNLVLSAIFSNIGVQMNFFGLINFGRFDNINYSILEIPIFIIIGCIGGLIGALFNEINHKLTIFRMKYLSNRPIKVLEAVLVSLLTAWVGFVLIILSNDCKPIDDLPVDNKVMKVQMNCRENEFSPMASLFLSNSEVSVINIFHMNAKIYSIITLSIFLVIYFLLSVITYGLSISSGIFIPALLIGGVFGRIVALVCHQALSGWVGTQLNIDELTTKYALIGAASVLGGIVRMQLSLTVILIETTGNLSLGLPLMICLLFAKWIGDSCNEGLYDIHIKLQQIPFLHCEPSMNNKEIDEDEIIFVQQIMSTPVVTLNRIETVRNILMILQNETHYGFPVVDSTSCFERTNDNYDSSTNHNCGIEERDEDEINDLMGDYTNLNQLKTDFVCPTDYTSKMKIKRALGHYGKLRGFVLRWQLIVLLQNKIFNTYLERSLVNITLDMFRDAYPRYDNIDKVIGTLTSREMDFKIDLSYVMNPSPYSVLYNCSFDRTYRLFRALGLRHLCVTDDSNNVIGIITRKDMSHFKVITHKNKRYIQKYSESIIE